MSRPGEPSIFTLAHREVRRPIALIVVLALATLLSMTYPSDLDSYPTSSPDAGLPAAVGLTENYLRFIPTIAQIALPLALGDRVGLVQLVYVGISTTIATHAAKRVLNNHWISNTRLGQRPSRSGSKHKMPSGHSSMASCAVYFIGRRYGVRFALLLTPILISTMYARVVLNDHTVSAVIAGALLGFLTTALFASRRRPAAARATSDEHASPDGDFEHDTGRRPRRTFIGRCRWLPRQATSCNASTGASHPSFLCRTQTNMNNPLPHPWTDHVESVATDVAAHRGVPKEVSADCAALYGRYIGLLALLCECAPYVDEPDYVDLIESALTDASLTYPIDFRRCDGSFELALRPGTCDERSTGC